MEKLKYVKIGYYNSIIVFPEIIEHSQFKHLNPKSAGFCFITEEKVQCYGESYSLGIKSDEEDSLLATKQICGVDAYLKIAL